MGIRFGAVVAMAVVALGASSAQAERVSADIVKGKRFDIVYGPETQRKDLGNKPPMGRGPGPMMLDPDGLFDRIDTDRNGVISKAEFKAFHARMLNHRGGPPQGRPGMPPRG